MSKLRCVGGPLDGGELPRGSSAFAASDDGAVYVLTFEPGRMHQVWAYAGPRAGRCAGCGAYLLPPPSGPCPRTCDLCGGHVRLPF